MENIILWWIGICVGLFIFSTLMYWITQDTEDEILNKDLYEFIEKYFGKKFLNIFKKFI